MEQTVERWYSMKEITEYLGVSRDTLLNRIANRNMPATKIRSRGLDKVWRSHGEMKDLFFC